MKKFLLFAAFFCGIFTLSAACSFSESEDDNGNKTIAIDITEYEADSILDENAYTTAILFWEGTKSYNEGSDNDGSYIEISGVRYYKK